MHRDDFAFNSGWRVVAFTKLSCGGNIKSLTISSLDSLRGSRWTSWSTLCKFVFTPSCSFFFFPGSFLVSLILVVKDALINEYFFRVPLRDGYLIFGVLFLKMNSALRGNICKNFLRPAIIYSAMKLILFRIFI